MTFDSLFIPLEPQPRNVPLLLPATNVRRLVRMCAWCKKVEQDQAWVEIQDAVEDVGLLEALHLNRITHAICPNCSRQMMKETITALREGCDS
jgi:hypothetical protein